MVYNFLFLMKQKFETVVFDMDGTLCDTRSGISHCVNLTLKKLDKKTFPDNFINKHIGPPVTKIFQLLLKTNDKELLRQCVYLFRKEYKISGLRQSRLFEGIRSLLDNFASSGLRLMIVTNKPKEFAIKIVETLKVRSYFKEIVGPEVDSLVYDKQSMLRSLIIANGLDVKKMIMVGDRKDDIIAARENGVTSIGVTYGFGSKKELQDAGADYICSTPSSIEKYVLIGR